MSPIETQITLLINRKSDVELIKQTIIDYNIKTPVYIFEYGSCFQLNFTSDYPEWELDSALLQSFSDYEFTYDLEKGRKEIRLQIARYQSEFSCDSWGRQIDNPLDETKYLVKKSNRQPDNFSSEVCVLFGTSERSYHINMIRGIDNISGNQGFLILDKFNTNENLEDADFFKDYLYKTPLEAFQAGKIKMQDIVNNDFEDYQEKIKKHQKEQQKAPRKIIRDFISSCNRTDFSGVVKNLTENIIFEKKERWNTILREETLSGFEEYIHSSNQGLCGKNFTIKSNWDFKLPNVIITVRFFGHSLGNIVDEAETLQQKQIHFVIENNKITHIIEH